jgi:hypothetical protein
MQKLATVRGASPHVCGSEEWGDVLVSMLDKDDKALSSSDKLRETPGGGSLSRSLISFCILRLSLAA